jgi:hypothetical protein
MRHIKTGPSFILLLCSALIEVGCPLHSLPCLGFSVAAKDKLWDNALKGTRKVTSFLTN